MMIFFKTKDVRGQKIKLFILIACLKKIIRRQKKPTWHFFFCQNKIFFFVKTDFFISN